MQNMDDIFEPTPFRDGTSLRGVSLHCELFELGQDKNSKPISPLSSQMPDEECFVTSQTTMDSFVKDIQQNVVPEKSPSFKLPGSLQSRKHCLSTCHSPKKKRKIFDLSTPIDAEASHVEKEDPDNITLLFPHQESRWDEQLFELGQDKNSKPISPLSSQMPDEECFVTWQTTMDSFVKDIQQNVVPEKSPSFKLPSSLQSRKRCLSTCHSPKKKRKIFDLSTSIDAEANHVEKEYPDNRTLFFPHQESRWDEQFKILVKFKEKHGHCHVPHTYKDDLALSRWAKRQRYQYKLKQENKPSVMSNERQQKLESLSFVWDPQTTVWEIRRKELEEYKKDHGNCNVPCRYKRKPQLAMWVKRQRRQYKLFKSGNKLSRLSDDRFLTLTKMGFNWELRLENGAKQTKIPQVQTANLALRHRFFASGMSV